MLAEFSRAQTRNHYRLSLQITKRPTSSRHGPSCPPRPRTGRPRCAQFLRKSGNRSLLRASLLNEDVSPRNQSQRSDFQGLGAIFNTLSCPRFRGSENALKAPRRSGDFIALARSRSATPFALRLPGTNATRILVGRGRDCVALNPQSQQREVAEFVQLHLSLASQGVPHQRTRQHCGRAKPVHQRASRSEPSWRLSCTPLK